MSGAELVKWMSSRKDKLRESYCGNGSSLETNASTVAEVDGKISAAVKKAMKYDLYLGLESTWLYKK